MRRHDRQSSREAAWFDAGIMQQDKTANSVMAITVRAFFLGNIT